MTAEGAISGTGFVLGWDARMDRRAQLPELSVSPSTLESVSNVETEMCDIRRADILRASFAHDRTFPVALPRGDGRMRPNVLPDFLCLLLGVA